ncbi:MAG: 4Fe-4S dicluster domain-containing protein [Halobacteriota archaeon]|nr:4Fe-4S dicluster domain-containing protein [Halobacteriota archaeon]
MSEISSDCVQGDFLKRVGELSGQELFSCIQCGKCSGGCPITNEMDIRPHQVAWLIELGAVDELINSKTIWLCASCFLCSSRCPKGVELPKIMESIRAIIMRDGTDFVKVKGVSPEILAEAPQQALVSAFKKFTSEI